jgi:Cytochrome c554 and c-prime
MLHRAASMALVSSLAALGCLTGFAFFASDPLRPAPVHAQATYKFTGAASCGGSNCHDHPKPRADYPRLNETAVWEQKDKHRKAYATLTNEKLKSGISPAKIARDLKIVKAEASERCLKCHAVNVKPELRGPKFQIADGVQCDACHGPAEKWLEPHAEKGWTHAQSVKVGMYDMENLLLRAEKCVSCHLAIDHELVAAGHPDLTAFELDTFSASMPPHWRDKGTWSGTRTWAVGQVISLREAAKQLAERAGGTTPPALVEDAWKKVQGYAAVVKHLFSVGARDAEKGLAKGIAALADAQGKGMGERAKVAAAADDLAKAMDQQAARIALTEFDQAGTQKILHSIAADADAMAAIGLRAAEQAAMALDRLYTTYAKAPGNKKEKPVSDALDKIFAGIEDPKKFDAKAFAADMKAFQRSFGK